MNLRYLNPINFRPSTTGRAYRLHGGNQNDAYIFAVNLKERDHLKGLRINVSIIINQILRK
jgi:hypothetical protein